MKLEEIKKLYDGYVLNTYARQDLCLVRGKGARVFDVEGREYIDLFPGWAVSGVGHCHPRVVARIRAQAENILHVSNNFYNEIQPLLAKKIIEHSFPGKVFFANSGAEANEGAIKLARRHGKGERYEIITMERSFHGRTLATLTATGQEKVKAGFYPLPEGFRHAPFNDIEALKKAVTPFTAAVLLEPVQGEGGVNVADKAFVKELRAFCDAKDILLIFDEVQTCMGRTGEMFAYRHFGIQPDAITLAKSLGGGMPVGALVVAEKHKDLLPPGSHASTFGGSPIVSAAALGVFEAIEEEGLLARAVDMGKRIVGLIERISSETGKIKRIKALGLMIGVELDMKDASRVAAECMERGVLLNCTQSNILRIMPPLTIEKEDVEKAINVLKDVLEIT